MTTTVSSLQNWEDGDCPGDARFKKANYLTRSSARENATERRFAEIDGRNPHMCAAQGENSLPMTGIGDALEDEVSLQCQYYHHAYRFLHNLQACHSIWDNTWSEHGMKPQVYCHCETVSIGGVRNLT
ncbi:uncharacterized protein [Physcomitrium patens]